MAEPNVSSLTTLFVVGVTVMAFFATSAADRAEEIESSNLQVVTILSLVGSYCLLMLFGLILVRLPSITQYPQLFIGMKIVFAGFVVPGLLLLTDHMDELFEARKADDFSAIRTLLGIAFVGSFYWVVLKVGPTV